MWLINLGLKYPRFLKEKNHLSRRNSKNGDNYLQLKEKLNIYLPQNNIKMYMLKTFYSRNMKMSIVPTSNALCCGAVSQSRDEDEETNEHDKE